MRPQKVKIRKACGQNRRKAFLNPKASFSTGIFFCSAPSEKGKPSLGVLPQQVTASGRQCLRIASSGFLPATKGTCGKPPCSVSKTAALEVLRSFGRAVLKKWYAKKPGNLSGLLFFTCIRRQKRPLKSVFSYVNTSLWLAPLQHGMQMRTSSPAWAHKPAFHRQTLRPQISVDFAGESGYNQVGKL